MTRETKIGLLVGLAFIIVIGILLSDHMTSTTDPPKAPLSLAGANVRESVAAPTSAQSAAAAAAAPPVAVAAPGQPVLTQQELTPPQRAPVQIQVGPGTVQQQPPITIQQTAQNPGPAQPTVAPAPQWQQPPQVAPQGPSPVTIAPTTGSRRGAHPLQGVAAQNGEEIVVLGDSGNVGSGTPAGQANPPVPMAPLREYKAQAGDSLSKLASRFLGSNTKSNRDAIIRANASLQQNPDKIVEGRTYLVPVASAAEAPAPASPAPAPAVVAKPAPAAPAADAPGVSWYTVKENDNLWKIAADQLGTGTAAKQIKELNGDLLKGNDNLQVGMRLRIPPKPVASAN